MKRRAWVKVTVLPQFCNVSGYCVRLLAVCAGIPLVVVEVVLPQEAKKTNIKPIHIKRSFVDMKIPQNIDFQGNKREEGVSPLDLPGFYLQPVIWKKSLRCPFQTGQDLTGTL
jgi:hypothetical protein